MTVQKVAARIILNTLWAGALVGFAATLVADSGWIRSGMTGGLCVSADLLDRWLIRGRDGQLET